MFTANRQLGVTAAVAVMCDADGSQVTPGELVGVFWRGPEPVLLPAGPWTGLRSNSI